MFRKEDFKNGMVVQLDTGERRLFWEGKFIDQYGFISLDFYDDNLNNIHRITKDKNIDIIYTTHDVRYFGAFFTDTNLTEIWNRYWSRH